MTGRITVDGNDRIAATLNTAAHDIGADRDTIADAARTALAGIGHVPRRSGRLAGSLRVQIRDWQTGPVGYVVSDVAYAGVIHYGWPARHIRPQPFAAAAMTAATPRIVTGVAGAVQHHLDTVRGA